MPALINDSLSHAQAEQPIKVAAWPCALTEDTSTSTGFVMPGPARNAPQDYSPSSSSSDESGVQSFQRPSSLTNFSF
jgi:hypothetical protein